MVRHVGICFLLLVFFAFGQVNQSGAQVADSPVEDTAAVGTRLVVFEAFMRPT